MAIVPPPPHQVLFVDDNVRVLCEVERALTRLAAHHESTHDTWSRELGGRSAEALIEAADGALYRAKRAGRDRWRSAD